MKTESAHRLEWPFEETVLVTLDLECDYGTALPENTYQAVEHIGDLVDVLERIGVPLSTFVQTELLDERPAVVEQLRNCGVDVRFHPHSHTHRPRDETSTDREIEMSTRRFESFFGRRPVGYRLPNGNVRQQDYESLAAAGYEFDASLFPSWRPNHFNNATAPSVPQYLPSYEFVEIPFTVLSRLVRVPTALSYCRLFGMAFTRLLTSAPPPVVVFNVHMHDFVNPPSYDDLPGFYKLIYSRNDGGFELFESLLDSFRERGYSFATIDEAYERLTLEI